MRISSLSSSFVFNLPSDFVPAELISRYQAIMEKNWIPYENIVDYLNSTIKEVTFPGLAIDIPEQNYQRKKINYRPATNVFDIVTTRQVEITFRSVDSDTNYFIMWELFREVYLNVNFPETPIYVNPFKLTSVDIHRDAIYDITFREIILTNLGDNKFSYNSQLVTEKLFTLTFNFNFVDIEFLLDLPKKLEVVDDKTKIVDTDPYPALTESQQTINDPRYNAYLQQRRRILQNLLSRK